MTGHVNIGVDFNFIHLIDFYETVTFKKRKREDYLPKEKEVGHTVWGKGFSNILVLITV